jgi:hypothetical protein
VTLLVAAIVLALLAAAWVVHPILFRRWGLVGDVVSPRLLDREARRRVALANLKDVEYDRVAGKLDDADYEEMKTRLELEALDAMRAHDSAAALDAEAPPTHACGFSNNPAGSRYCAGCGRPLG